MKERLAYVTFRVLAAGFGALPEPVMRRVGEGLGYAASFAARDKMAMAERHMRRVLGPDANTRHAARRVFASYGRYWAETFWLRPRRLRQLYRNMNITGLSSLNEARANGSGIIFALPHVGNWEIAGARAVTEGLSVLAVAESLANKRITEWFLGLRNAMGMEIVLAGEGSGVTRALIKHLKSGGTAALMADRDLGGRGVEVEFFGERTTMPAGPMALADRTGAVVLTMGPYHREGRGYHMAVHPPVEVPDLPTRDERVVAGTQALALRFESIIREAPTQWHLLVPNWPSDRE